MGNENCSRMYKLYPTNILFIDFSQCDISKRITKLTMLQIEYSITTGVK
jgi:hypothetical protein